jgi:tRNA pseudouridine55 synthase
MKNPDPNGLLVLDKPQGLTSRAALNRVQKWFPRGTRLGHAGTLDPLATGVLVVCVGTATRLVEYVQRMDKEYVTDLVLGAVSDSDDADGTVTTLTDAPVPTAAALNAELPHFLGWIEQVPPAYSAAKVSGARAHELARQGEDVTLTPRRVRIDAVEVLHYDYPAARLHLRCGKGTYVRSVARDLGQRLGCGAYVRTLRRLRIGPFTPEQAVPLDRDPDAPVPLLPPERAVVDLPIIRLSAAQVRALCQGQAVRLPTRDTPAPVPGGNVAVFVQDELVAVGRWDPATRMLVPEKVLRSAVRNS